MARNDARQTVGSVNAAEFFVTVAASVTFVLMLGLSHWLVIAGLAAGGLLAAPFGAWACSRLPLKPLMAGVGILVIPQPADAAARALSRATESCGRRHLARM